MSTMTAGPGNSAPAAQHRLHYWLDAVVSIIWGRRGRLLQVVAWLAVALVVLRLALPSILLVAVNRSLAAGGAIRGHVESVSLSLLGSRVGMGGLLLTEHDPDGRVHPLLEMESLRVRLSWLALLRGDFAGSVALVKPVLHTAPVAKEATGKTQEPSPDTWRSTMAKLVHVRMETLLVTDGTLVYEDPAKEVHVRITDVTGRVEHIAVPAPGTPPTTFTFGATTPGGGTFSLNGDCRLVPERPEAYFIAALEHVDLPSLNALLVRYDGPRFNGGSFSGYVEAKLAERQLAGEFKPIFRHLDVAAYRQKDGKKAGSLLWSLVAPVAAWILHNSEEDQHAARIPIQGRVEDPNTDLWTIIGSALANAFIQALAPGFDDLGRQWVTSPRPSYRPWA